MHNSIYVLNKCIVKVGLVYMNNKVKYLLLIIAILCVILAIQTCQPTAPHPTHPLINSDSIAQMAYSKGYEIAKLEEIGKVKDSIQTHYVTKWKVYRERAIRDTVLLECVTNCDSALNTQSDYICHLETISSHKDPAIVYWRDAYRSDSTNVMVMKVVNDSLGKVNKKLRRRVMFWKVVSAIEAAVIAGQVVMD